MREIIGFIFLTIGALFDLFGCIGLVRLPDVYNRLQASTKCVTLGTCLILVSIIIMGTAPIGTKSFLCAIFILVSSPTAAHALSRGAHLAGIKLWEKSICDKLEEDERDKTV